MFEGFETLSICDFKYCQKKLCIYRVWQNLTSQVLTGEMIFNNVNSKNQAPKAKSRFKMQAVTWHKVSKLIPPNDFSTGLNKLSSIHKA